MGMWGDGGCSVPTKGEGLGEERDPSEEKRTSRERESIVPCSRINCPPMVFKYTKIIIRTISCLIQITLHSLDKCPSIEINPNVLSPILR